jgi:hypothetical protein
VGFEISFRVGLLNRKAILADLSVRGCRLLSHMRFEVGKRIRLQIPEALETGDPFSIGGRISRVDFDPKAGDGGLYSAGVLFDRVTDTAREALEIIIEDRAQGPAMLRGARARASRSEGGATDAQRATPGEDPSTRVDIEVDVRLEREAEPSESAASAKAGAERRQSRRGAYEQTVPAFGNRALRVLVGRDLSVGGMRIERLPGLEPGDRLHLAIYGDPGDPPFLIWGTVSHDDGDRGMGLVFDPVEPEVGHQLESLVGNLPAVESLRDSEVEAMGTVMSEILDS